MIRIEGMDRKKFKELDKSLDGANFYDIVRNEYENTISATFLPGISLEVESGYGATIKIVKNGVKATISAIWFAEIIIC